MSLRQTVLFLAFLIAPFSGQAQSPVPLGETIRMQITARDTELLMVYNIYSFECTVKDGDKFSADFLILKEHDTISHKSYILGQLTLVKEFILFPGKQGAKPTVLHTEDGIEISTNKGMNKQAYLNFDPTLPDPVFILKQVARESTL
jgi:hypothetical protein